MQDFKTFYKQQLMQESFKQEVAGIALALSLALTTGIGLNEMGVLRTKEQLRAAMQDAQQSGYNVREIVQKSQGPQILQQAQQIAKKDAAKSQQLYKKAVETSDAIRQPSKIPAVSKVSSEEFHRLAMNYIRENELGGAGIDYHKPYKDRKGLLTIGVGHLVTDKEKAAKTFKKRLTEDQVLDLFKKDIKSKLDSARRLFPKYEQYPTDLKIKLLDGIFRGDVSGSPNTIKLINKGQWERAANEFLDSKEYKDAAKHGYGTAPRMKQIANAIRSMAKKDESVSIKPKLQPETTPFF